MGQAAVLDAFQPNPLAERRQFRVDRFDLIKGDHLGTTELFALDLAANPFPGLPVPGNTAPLTASDASPGGTRFAACRSKEPQRLDVWNLAESKHVVAWKPHADKVEWCGFVDEDRVLTLGDGKLILWKLPSLKAEYVVEGYRGKPCFSANRKHVLLVNGTALELIEAATGQRLGRLDAPAGMTLTRLQSAGFSPDGKELIAVVFTGAGNQIVRWDLSSGAFKESMDAKLVPANAGVLWAGPRNVLAGNVLFNWDLKAPIWQYTLPGPGTAAAGSPDGRHWFAFGTGKEGPSVLAAQTIPDAGASQLAQLASAGQVRQAVPPGTKFQIAINGFAAAQNDIVTTATNNLKNAGYSAGAGGVTINITAQENATGKFLDYEIRKVGKFGLPKGGKQMIKVAEKKVACQLTITDAAGAILEKRDLNFSTLRLITFEGDNYQAELDRLMWNSAANFARGAMLPANLYRVEGQLQALPKMAMLKAGG